ncbi:MAG: hypothetical protein EBV73_07590 [Rhodocyclales bacterium]|nr:hypothetical protein [Rhodocyclales bacterium]
MKTRGRRAELPGALRSEHEGEVTAAPFGAADVASSQSVPRAVFGKFVSLRRLVGEDSSVERPGFFGLT